MIKRDELLEEIKNGIWTAADIVADYVHKQFYLLGVLLVLAVVGVSAGVVISSIGLSNLSPGIITFGQIVTGASTIAATMMALYIGLKNTAVLYGGTILNRIASNFVREASRPLPSTPIEIDEFIRTEDIGKFINGFFGGYAVLAFLGYAALVFPAYTLPSIYFGIIIGAVFVAFAGATWGPTGPWVERFQKWSIGFVVVTMFIGLVLFFVPSPVKRHRQNILLEEARFQAEQENLPNVKSRITQLQREINAINNDAALDASAKQTQIEAKEAEIARVSNGGKKTLSDYDFPSIPTWVYVAVALLIVLLVISFTQGGAAIAKTAITGLVIVAVLYIVFGFFGGFISWASSGASNNGRTSATRSSNGPASTTKGALVVGEPYKFPDRPEVYLFRDGKMRHFYTMESFLDHYGCSRSINDMNECRYVNDMPAGLKPSDALFNAPKIR